MLSALIALVSASSPVTVVMIHGAGGGGWEYDHWRPVFERAGYQVIARDLLPSKSGLAETTFEDYVRQVQFWRPVTGRVILVGASMGGILALKSASLEPVEAIVLVNSVPPKGIRTRAAYVYPPVVKWANGPLKDTEVSMPDSSRETILWAWKRWRDESGSVMNEISRGIPLPPPTSRCLVVISEEDTDIPPSVSLKLAKWAKADVRRYTRMSHVGPLLGTRSRKVAADVIAWIKSESR